MFFVIQSVKIALRILPKILTKDTNIVIEHYYAGKHCKLPHKSDFDSIRNLTRMHSSRMRTARLLTVSQYALAGGVPARGCTCQGGVPAGGVPARGCTCQGKVYLLRRGVGVPGGGCTCPGGTCRGTSHCEQND